ncbi:MFS transporter [Nocardia terpenica]|uniref:MFS transporter n=1 Tax=Nocardia terpenica TaxID=455432 RepID=A0A291RRP5_9NOCA|nr:MFS transporter [Nocardia terpenica]ATL69912.1 MFS transporter [Nocardia terpenica]
MNDTEYGARQWSNPAYRWVVLVAATVTQASSCFFVQGIGAIGIYLQNGLHLNSTQLGLLISAAQLVPILGLLAVGELLDRYSERAVVGIGTLVLAAALMLGGLADNYAALLLVLVIVGAGYSTAQPGGSKSVAQWFNPSQRGLAMGIRQAGLPLGGALAAAVLPQLATHYGWKSCFIVSGIVTLVGAAVFITLYRQPTDLVRNAPRPPARSARRAVGSRLGMIKDPSMVRIMISGMALVAVQYGILVFTVPYLRSGGVGVGNAAAILFITQMAGVTGRILLATWSDRSTGGRYVPVLICMSGVSVGLGLLTVAPLHNTLVAGLLLAWIGFFGFGWYGPWVVYVAESAPSDKTGFALGLAMAVNEIIVVATPPGLGFLQDVTGSYRPGWAVLIGISLLALAATMKKPTVVRTNADQLTNK